MDKISELMGIASSHLTSFWVMIGPRWSWLTENWYFLVIGFTIFMFIGGFIRTCFRGLGCLPAYLKHVWHDFGSAFLLLPFLMYLPFREYVTGTMSSAIMLVADVTIVGLFLLVIRHLAHLPRTDLVPSFVHLHNDQESGDWLLLPRNGVGHSSIISAMTSELWSVKMMLRTTRSTLGKPALLDDLHTARGQARWMRFAGEAIGEAQGACGSLVLGALVRESNVYTRNPDNFFLFRLLSALMTPSNPAKDDKFRKLFIKYEDLIRLADPEFAASVKVERYCDIQKIAHLHYLALELQAQVKEYGEDPAGTEARNYPGFWRGFIAMSDYDFAPAPHFGLPEELHDFDPKKVARFINNC